MKQAYTEDISSLETGRELNCGRWFIEGKRE
jgi:hypothetical protein